MRHAPSIAYLLAAAGVAVWSGYRGLHPVFLLAAVVGIATILLSILLRSGEEDRAETGNRAGTWWRYWSLSAILLLASLVAFALRGEQYVKPLSYYILVSLSTAAAFGALLKAGGRSHYLALVGLSATIALSHVWTENLLFPQSVMGLDPWTHARVATQEIDVALGRVPNDYGISLLRWDTIGGYYSLMHIYVNFLLRLLGWSYKWLALVFVGTPQVLATIVLSYLVGSELWNRKVGVLSSLLIANAGWVLLFSMWTVPNSLGLPMVLLAAYVCLRNRGGIGLRSAGVLLAVLSLALLTHIVVALWVAGVLLCFSVTLRCRNLSGVTAISLALLVPWLWFTSVGGAAVETAVATQSNAPQFDVPQSNALQLDTPQLGAPQDGPPVYLETTGDGSTTDISPTPLSRDVLNNGGIAELFAATAGSLFYFALGIAGTTLLLRRGTRGRAWYLLCLGPATIGVAASLLQVAALQDRWWLLSQATLSLPASALLLSWAYSRQRAAAVAVTVGLLTFLSTVGLPANNTQRLLAPNLIARYGMTGEEIVAQGVLDDYRPAFAGADSYYLSLLQSDAKWYYPKGTKVGPVDLFILSGRFDESPYDALLLRAALREEPLAYGSGAVYRVDYDPIGAAMDQGYEKVWDNEAVTYMERPRMDRPRTDGQ